METSIGRWIMRETRLKSHKGRGLTAITHGTDRTSNILTLNKMIDWEQVRVDAAISALQGVLESGKLGMVLEVAPEVVAKQSVMLAEALIEELNNCATDKRKKKILCIFASRNKKADIYRCTE